MRRFGASSVAARLEVNPSTLRRWVKNPRLITDRTIELLKFLDDEIPVTAKVVRDALKLNAMALAAVAGVSVSTARRWKKNKRIPKRSQRFLEDDAPEARPKRLRTETRAFGPRALFTEGYELTTDVNAIVTTTLIRMLARWGADLRVPGGPRPKGPGPKFQYVFQGSILLGFDETLQNVGSSKDVQSPIKEPNGFELHTMAVPSLAWADRSKAFREFIANLEGVQDQSFFIQGATLWIRWDKLKPGFDQGSKSAPLKTRYPKTRATKKLIKQLTKNKKARK